MVAEPQDSVYIGMVVHGTGEKKAPGVGCVGFNGFIEFVGFIGSVELVETIESRDIGIVG